MFEWRNEFSTNIPEIDSQHKKLFEIGTRLYDIVALKDETDHYDEITAILDELKDYTDYHFGFEENVLKQRGYEQFETHKMEHDFFVKKLRKIEASDFDENQSESMIKMVTFVADWISAHILQSDAHYAACLKG